MQREEILKGLRAYKLENTEKYGIRSLGIFGSFARKEQNKKSDIDIIVDIKEPDIFILSDIKQDIEDIFHCSVDVVRMHQRLNPLFKKRIDKEAIYV